MTKSDRKGTKVTPRDAPHKAQRARKYWAPKDRLPVVSDVLSGRRDYLEACRHYDVQSNQVYAWAGQAIITERPEALQAMASNSGLMMRLDALRSQGSLAVAPAARTERDTDRDIVARLIKALEGAERGPEPPGPAAGSSKKLSDMLSRILADR